MIIKVTKKHLKDGVPTLGECPLSLAFQDAFRLNTKHSKKLVCVSRKCLTLYNYSGRIIYTVKLPPIAEAFNDKFWGHYEYFDKFHKLPKPCEFEIGVVDYIIEKVDVLDRMVFDIHNVHGDMEYDG